MTDLKEIMRLANEYGMHQLPAETTPDFIDRVKRFHNTRMANMDKHPYRRAFSEKRQREIE